MSWISWGMNQICTAKFMLKVFSLIKKFFKGGPTGRPHGQSGGAYGPQGQKNVAH